MEWMDDRMIPERMPGLATGADFDELNQRIEIAELNTRREALGLALCTSPNNEHGADHGSHQAWRERRAERC